MINLMSGTRKMQVFMFLGLASVCGLGACDSPITQELAPDPSAVSMDIVSGNAQSGPAGTELPNPVVVRVLNSSGQPVPNQIVNFKIQEGGGNIFAGAALTNAQGIAQERWTLGPTPGSPQVLEARAVDPSTGEKRVFAQFTATALDPGTMVASVSVSPSSANIVTGATQQLTATARNANGATLTGKTFAWQSSNTTVATVSSSGVVTGRAAGSATITASTEGRTGSASVVISSATTADTIPPGTPGAPSITTSAVSADSFSVTASWGPATDATRYQWNTGSNSGTFSKQGQLTGRTVTFRARLLNDGNGYWFCVAGVDAAGNSSVENACAGYTSPASNPPPPPPPSPTVASVTVTPASSSVAVGATQQLTATARDASGNTISGKTFTWSSNNTTVATVSGSGLVTGRAAGNATITAAVDGHSGTSTITVTSTSTPPPPPPPSGVAPRLVEDFSSYTSISHYLSDPRNIYAESETQGSSRMAIDTSVGYGSSNRSLRYTHSTGETISRSIDLRGWNLGSTQDLWTEIVVRFSPGWDVGFSYKLYHLIVNPSIGRRFGLDFQEPRIFAEAPAQNWDANMMWGWNQDRLFDGQWHTIRYHTRIVSGGAQVMHEWWIDGEYQGSRGPTAGNGSLAYVFAVLGANMNESPGQTQQLWWGKVSIWTENPGW